jgi:serine/threonine protein kinase
MGLGTGTVLGSYEIASPLGAGGMGEVYRARDTKLGREVAIKILPESFAQDPERLARFQREAQLLAALNHPHIGGIHGLEDAGATRFLVLEFIDGESLAERLTAAGASGLEVRETLTIARQIVDALESAHEKGIIHRDLKPANIMLTHDGQVKVLDFGLAKIDVGSGGSSGPGGLTHSPTLTFAATQAGVILGTAAYMSPEQAKGRAADKRSDVWAFGCVLFEMLTGKRAFEGEDVSDTLAAILRGEPDWNAFPADLTQHVRTIVKRCLAKDRKVRIPDFAVVRFLLDEPAAPAVASEPLRPVTPQSTTALHAWQAIAALGLLAALGAGAAWYRLLPAPTVARFFVTAPDKTSFVINTSRPGASAAISPDGLKLAFTARDAGGKTLLWIRPIDSLSAQSLPGTDDAAYPFWSPDSRTLGYSTRGRLMKVAASGGPPQTLCEFSGTTIVGRGGTWNRDGVILFSNGPGQPLSRVSSAGGPPSQAWKLPDGQAGEVFPSFLPDGHHVLFAASSTNDGAYAVFGASLDTGEMRRLLGADTSAVYAAPGYLLFVRQGTLLAQSFDAKTLALSGDPFPIAERVESAAPPGLVSFSASSSGILSYGIGSAAAPGVRMALLDREGKLIQSLGPEAAYQGVALSPDGKRIAAHRHDGDGGDIWLTDTTRGTTSRLTFDASQDNSSPVWSPDGSEIVFASRRAGKWGLYRKRADNSGAEELLYESASGNRPVHWSPDGTIVFQVLDSKTIQDLWTLSLSGARRATPWLQTPFGENEGRISPDGRFIAYMSNETGRYEVYVRTFPSGGGKWQISNEGAIFPIWRRDGHELFFLSPRAVMVIDYQSSGATFEAGTAKPLLETRTSVAFPGGGGVHPFANFDISSDGQRLLVARATSQDTDTGPSPIVVVTNWTAAIR